MQHLLKPSRPGGVVHPPLLVTPTGPLTARRDRWANVGGDDPQGDGLGTHDPQRDDAMGKAPHADDPNGDDPTVDDPQGDALYEDHPQGDDPQETLDLHSGPPLLL